MKKSCIIVYLLCLFLIPLPLKAQRGCCSHHGGVASCSSSGRQVCNDGTLSPTCTCTPSYLYGCTDSSAKNYNSKANKDNGTCTYYKKGCTDQEASNYDSKAEKDDGTCIKKVLGCTDKNATNYNHLANKSDGSCQYKEETIKKIEENKIQNEQKIDFGSALGGTVVLGSIGTTIYLATKKKKEPNKKA